MVQFVLIKRLSINDRPFTSFASLGGLAVFSRRLGALRDVAPNFIELCSKKMSLLRVYIYEVCIFLLVCPTGSHPPLRLARRPNRGGGWTSSCGTCLPVMFFIASGFSTSTLVNREVNMDGTEPHVEPNVEPNRSRRFRNAFVALRTQFHEIRS